MKETIIRKAKITDIDSLAELLAVLFTIETDFNGDTDLQKSGLSLMLERPDQSCILVAEHNNIIIGMCTGQLLASTAEGGLKVLIEDLVVKEDHRNSGIGSRLLSEIEKWAISCGVKRLDLLADRNNTPALNFYRKEKWNTTELIALQKRL